MGNTTTIHDGGAEYSADSAAPSDDDTRVHRLGSAATTYDRSAEYSADSAPPTGDCFSVYRQCGAATIYDYSAASAADEPGIPSEIRQLATPLREMGQDIAQGSHQNINHLTQATADQARILGHEIQEMVDTTLSDQHQRYLDSTKRVEQNIGIINDQYLGATQRQGRRIDQVAGLIAATGKNLEERMERVQRDIQAHAQTVARVHRLSQQQTDTRPDTTTRKAPAAANHVPRRRPQITGQTRSNPMQPTGIDPPPNQSAKAVPSLATHQASPNEQPHRNPPDAPQSTPKAPPSTSSTTDEEPLPPLAGKELWQGTERVWKMIGTFTPKGTDYDERKGKQCEEFPSFAKRFEHMAEFYEIPRANWAQMCAACLATNAHDEYLAMSKEQQNDFDQTIEHLGKIYPAPMRNEWTYRIQWDALRQGQDEPLRDFVGRIESLAHKAHTSLNPRGLEFEKIMKFRHGLASSFLRYDLAIVTAETLQELGERAIMIQLKRNSDPATMWARTTEASEVARDLGTTPISIARTAQFEPQQHPMGEVTRLPYAYPHIMPPATTCVTYVPASSFAVPATPPPPTPSYNPPTQPPPGHPQGSEQRRQQPKDEGYPKKRPGDYQRGMDLASIRCYNCGEPGHLANKCPRPDKRLQRNYHGGNRGRGSRGGNRANSHTDNRQSSDVHTPPVSTSDPQNVPPTEQPSATQDPNGRQYRAQGVPTNANLDPSMDDVGFDLLMSSDSRCAMIRFVGANLTSSRSKPPFMHTQALTTEEETEQFKELLAKQERTAPAPPSTVPKVPKPFSASAAHGVSPSSIAADPEMLIQSAAGDDHTSNIISKSLAQDILGRHGPNSAANVDGRLRCNVERITEESIEFVKFGTSTGNMDCLKSKHEILKTDPSTSQRKFGLQNGHPTRTATPPVPTPTKRAEAKRPILAIDPHKSAVAKAAAGSTVKDEKPSVQPLQQPARLHDMPAPKRILIDLSDVHTWHPRRIHRGIELKNMGNTCFLNSVLQCVSFTPPLVNYSSSGHLRNYSGFCSLCAIREHMKKVHQQQTSFYALVPKFIVQNMRIIMKSYTQGRHEDAHEFLRFLVDSTQTSSLREFEATKADTYTKETTPISRIFAGFHRNLITCAVCAGKSITVEPFYNICLEIRNYTSIRTALRHSTKRDTLEGANCYNCPKCKKKVVAHKLHKLHWLPAILTIQPKRFDAHSGKIGKHVESPELLDVRPYTSLTGPEMMYKPYGVIVHVGASTHPGHYDAYGKNAPETWHRMDDSSVPPAGKNVVLSCSAYVLFYARCGPLNYTDSTEGPQIGSPVQKKGNRSLSMDSRRARVSAESIPDDLAPSTGYAHKNSAQYQPTPALCKPSVAIISGSPTPPRLKIVKNGSSFKTTSGLSLQTSAYTPVNITLPPKVVLVKTVKKADSTSPVQAEPKVHVNPFNTTAGTEFQAPNPLTPRVAAASQSKQEVKPPIQENTVSTSQLVPHDSDDDDSPPQTPVAKTETSAKRDDLPDAPTSSSKKESQREGATPSSSVEKGVHRRVENGADKGPQKRTSSEISSNRSSKVEKRRSVSSPALKRLKVEGSHVIPSRVSQNKQQRRSRSRSRSGSRVSPDSSKRWNSRADEGHEKRKRRHREREDGRSADDERRYRSDEKKHRLDSDRDERRDVKHHHRDRRYSEDNRHRSEHRQHSGSDRDHHDSHSRHSRDESRERNHSHHHHEDRRRRSRETSRSRSPDRHEANGKVHRNDKKENATAAEKDDEPLDKETLKALKRKEKRSKLKERKRKEHEDDVADEIPRASTFGSITSSNDDKNERRHKKKEKKRKYRNGNSDSEATAVAWHKHFHEKPAHEDDDGRGHRQHDRGRQRRHEQSRPTEKESGKVYGPKAEVCLLIAAPESDTHAIPQQKQSECPPAPAASCVVGQ